MWRPLQTVTQLHGDRLATGVPGPQLGPRKVLLRQAGLVSSPSQSHCLAINSVRLTGEQERRAGGHLFRDQNQTILLLYARPQLHAAAGVRNVRERDSRVLAAAPIKTCP